MTYPLPAVGSVEIGRSEAAQLRLLDVGASRRHATLHVGEQVTVQDHGSINGTFVRGKQIEPNAQVVLHPGEALQIGATAIVLQQRPIPINYIRVWPHLQFEARVEDECHRALQLKLPFCVMRIAVDESVSSEDLIEGLQHALLWTDAVAPYAPGEWEVLLSMREESLLEEAIEAVTEAFEGSGAQSDAAIARFPDDGRSADSLLCVVQDRLHRGSAARSPEGTVVESPSMIVLYELSRRTATSDLSLLLLGETGVGKDVLA